MKSGSGARENDRQSPAKQPAVFLDRDGVIVDALVRAGKPYPPPSAAQMRVAADAPQALAALNGAGYRLIVVTNQPDVARGTQDRAEVERMHARLRSELPIDDILVCYHDDADGCRCRKPLPGLLEQACVRYAIDLGRSFVVGDRWRDIEAGHAAGCSTIWIDRGYSERGPSEPATKRVRSLGEAAHSILSA